MSGDDIRLLDHPHIQAVILAIVALHCNLGQVVLVQQLGKRLDKGDVRIGGLFAHAVL
jgi:hypothetical protein